MVAFDQRFLGGCSAVELVRNVRRRNTGTFAFGEAVSVLDQYIVRRLADTPHPNIPIELSGLGLSVVLPEWTASAVGWASATGVDVARVRAPETKNFAVRIARVA